MAMSALPTSALSSLEAMLHSLMRGSGGGGGGAGGGGDDVTPIDDALSSSSPPPPPPPPLPARPTPRDRRPSRPRRRFRVQDAGPRVPPPPPSSIEEDATAATDGVVLPSVVEELGRKAAEVEARLRDKEEENAALRRRIESYHVRWLEHEIRTKALEEAFHEQMAALQMAQDAARMAEGTAHECRGSSEETAAEEDPPPVRLWHGRDRMSSCVGARRGTVGRLRLLGAEFRRQNRTLERAAEPGPWQPAAPAANSAADLKKLKAQFRAWAKDYKARLRRAQAEIGRDRRRRGSCWIRTNM